MRNILATIAITLLSINAAFAQKYGYVDSDYILSNIPDYKQAQNQLDNMSSQWQGEIESLYSEAEALQTALNAEKILLTEKMIAEREKMIAEKKDEALSLQQKYFGAQGELFQKRMELVKPIQDQVYNAIQSLAKKKKYDIIFDKSSDLLMLYTNPRADLSDEVLESLGY
ncbi:MAG: OmpH family outer membrane protein [Schleiferiaceae bacterium]|jgi:outer membrane protein|nr:OmpH family outer membrane protein [Schleiferiaceae bacterium]